MWEEETVNALCGMQKMLDSSRGSFAQDAGYIHPTQLGLAPIPAQGGAIDGSDGCPPIPKYPHHLVMMIPTTQHFCDLIISMICCTWKMQWICHKTNIAPNITRLGVCGGTIIESILQKI
jgi:hypothetical protein